MALYAYTTYEGVPDGVQTLDPGTAACVPFTLAQGGHLVITLLHPPSDNVQNFTIVGWVSKEKLGPPDLSLPEYLQSWKPNGGLGTLPVTIADRNSGAGGSFVIPADPGDYFMNVLNLTNTSNQFSLTIQEPAATP